MEQKEVEIMKADRLLRDTGQKSVKCSIRFTEREPREAYVLNMTDLDLIPGIPGGLPSPTGSDPCVQSQNQTLSTIRYGWNKSIPGKKPLRAWRKHSTSQCSLCMQELRVLTLPLLPCKRL